MCVREIGYILRVLSGLFPQCDHVKILAFGCKWRNMQFDMQRNRYFLVPINCTCINESLRAVFGSFEWSITCFYLMVTSGRVSMLKSAAKKGNVLT